jgi:NADPH-dependent curcumin reductase CurA
MHSKARLGTIEVRHDGFNSSVRVTTRAGHRTLKLRLRPSKRLRNQRRLRPHHPDVQDFLVLDWWHRRDEALKRVAAWSQAGRIRFRKDVLEGIESMPEAFLRLLDGRNFGKQLVRIS